MVPTPEDQSRIELDWQQKLLPLMSRMIILLAAFFLIASLAQVIYLEYAITGAPKFDSKEALSYLTPKMQTSQQIIEETRLKAQVMLEGHMADNLYHQGHVLLMARIWTSYIGFLTGMILALVGATFVLGKVSSSKSELGAKSNLWEISFKSASPGLMLAVLGTILMLAAILTHHDISTNQQAVYLRDSSEYRKDAIYLPRDSPAVPRLPAPKGDTSINH